MKPIQCMVPVLALAAVAFAGCSTVMTRPADVIAPSEEQAIAMLGDDINTLGVRLPGKKIGVFTFTAMDWTATPAGTRISAALDRYLVKTKKLRMLPRAELERIMKSEVAEQAGMYDLARLQERAGALPVDAMVYGTVDSAGNSAEVMVRVLDVRTGKHLLVTGVRMPLAAGAPPEADPGMLLLNRKSPEKVVAMNKAYFMLSWMRERQPLVFLLVVLDDREVASLASGKTVLGEKLNVRADRYRRERPDVMQKIRALKDGLALLERYSRPRHAEVLKWKKDLLARTGR